MYIALLADSDYQLRDWTRASGYPTIIVLNDKMEIIQPSSRGLNAAFDKLIQILNSEKKVNAKN